MNSSQTRRMIAAGMIGNVLEWYDFAIYSYFATAIGRHFSPFIGGSSGRPAAYA
jgi:MHS family proline/betaine transporter-like MFS transporter